MTPIEYLPIYTTTDDKRINDFLEKQRLTSSLLRTPLSRVPLRLAMVERKGGGISDSLLMVLVALLIFSFVAATCSAYMVMS